MAEVAGGPNGAALGPDSALYLCNNGGCFSWIEHGDLLFPGPLPGSWLGGSIDRLDLSTGAAPIIKTATTGQGEVIGLREPNDLVFDAHGGVWFTDHGTRSDRSTDRTGIYYARLGDERAQEVVFPVDSPS